MPRRTAKSTRGEASPAPFVDEYLLYLMARASSLASAGFHAQLHEAGVAVSDWRVMAVLWGTEGVTIGRLARRCLSKQPSLTKIVDRMETQGLVRRLPSENDRREVLVALTDRGADLVSGLIERAREHEATVLADFSPSEAETLKQVLRRLIDRHKDGGSGALAEGRD